MRIGLFQYSIDHDIQQVLAKIEAAVSQDFADLWVLPEMCLTGFRSSLEAMYDGLEEHYFQRIIDICRKSQTQICGSFCVEEQGKMYNRFLLFNQEGVSAQYDKRKLFTLWNEQDLFTAGSKPVVTTIHEVSTAFQVCFDLRFPELFREVVGVECFLVVANWPASRREHWLTLLRSRAIENQAYVVGVNCIGQGVGLGFCGDSVAFDYRGRELVHLEDREATAFIEINLEALKRFRLKYPFLPL